MHIFRKAILMFTVGLIVFVPNSNRLDAARYALGIDTSLLYITRIQSIMAADPAIYPEGKVTGVWDAPSDNALLRLHALLENVEEVLKKQKRMAEDYGQETAMKTSMSKLRAQAGLYYDSKDSYTGLCKSSHVSSANKELKALKSGNLICKDSAKGYRAYSASKTQKNYYCVDSTGNGVVLNKAPKKSSLTCE